MHVCFYPIKSREFCADQVELGREIVLVAVELIRDISQINVKIAWHKNNNKNQKHNSTDQFFWWRTALSSQKSQSSRSTRTGSWGGRRRYNCTVWCRRCARDCAGSRTCTPNRPTTRHCLNIWGWLIAFAPRTNDSISVSVIKPN